MNRAEHRPARLRRILLAILAAGALAGPAAALDRLDAEKLDARMDGLMQAAIDRGAMTGAVALVEQDGRVAMLRAYGHSDAAGTRPMQTDDLFRIASMTKPVVSAAVMSLVEEGRINLETPIAVYLPELADLKLVGPDGQAVAPRRQPTVHDLLRHTGGFTYSSFGAADPAIRALYKDADVEQVRSDMTAEEMMQRLAAIPLAFEPGTRFEYSVGVDLLGFVAERVSGQPLPTLLEQRIFGPLGMTQTGFAVASPDAARLAEVPAADPMKPFTEGWMRVTADRGKGYVSGGGGLVSTAGDYLRFARMMLNGGALDGRRILSPATVRLMMSDHIVGLDGGPDAFTGPGYGFGLGFAVRRAEGGPIVPGSVGDANWSGLNGTTFTIDPAENLVGILMAAAPTARNDLRFGFRNVIYGALGAGQEAGDNRDGEGDGGGGDGGN